jgi:hypothetical protein
VSVYRDTCVKAEALHACTGFPRDELNILGFDPISKPHDRLSSASARGDSVLQRGCGTCGEERLFVLQRVLGGITMIREQATTLEQANDAPGRRCYDAGDLVVVRRGEREELGRPRVGWVRIDSVEKNRMKMHVQVHRSTPALNLRYRARLTLSYAQELLRSVP